MNTTHLTHGKSITRSRSCSSAEELDSPKNVKLALGNGLAGCGTTCDDKASDSGYETVEQNPKDEMKL